MKLFTEKHKNQFGGYDITFHATGWIAIVAVVCCIIAVCMVGCPSYNVWQQEMSGKAEFAKAEQNRRIKIEEVPNKVVYIPTEANLPILEAKK